VDYAALTVNDRNPLKRKLQNYRLNHALKTIPLEKPVSILDYGSGDGELCLRINRISPETKIVSYEPSENLRNQAFKKLSNLDKISVVSTTKDLTAAHFDYIFCLEVFEHLPTRIIKKEFEEFSRLLKPDGKLIIGVPNELYFAALFKGALRVKRRYGDEDAVFINIFRSALGFPPKFRPEVDFDGLPYIIRHVGFDYRLFRKELMKHFKLESCYGSPLPMLSPSINLEVYFVCTLK
jgi:SAM-dependent methyltransferase